MELKVTGIYLLHLKTFKMQSDPCLNTKSPIHSSLRNHNGWQFEVINPQPVRDSRYSDWRALGPVSENSDPVSDHSSTAKLGEK